MIKEIEQEVTGYKKNRDLRIILNGDIDEKNMLVNNRVDEINEKYGDIISKIEKEKHRLINDIKDDKNRYVEQKKTESNNLDQPIEEVERKIKFLQLAKEIKNTDVTINDKEMSAYSTYRDEKLYRKGFFFKDQYMKIKIYIAENDKPVNKYTLFALGNCVFKDFMDLPDDYGLPVHSDRGNIKIIIKDLPTVEEINVYLEKNRKSILKNLIDRFNVVKKEYLDAIRDYRLSDFKTVLEVRSISENDAQLVCIIDKTTIDKTRYLRLYNSFYYWSVKKIEGNDDVFEYIRVNRKLYKRDCRKEVMSITQTGNTTFGDWWSMHIEHSHSNKSNTVFNKKNYDRIVEEGKNWIKEKNKNRVTKIHFSYPKVKWVNPDVILKESIVII